MNVRFAAPAEIIQWNRLIQSNPDGGSVFSSTILADLKLTQGWVARYVVIHMPECSPIAVTILEKTIPLLGRLWYAIKGPGVNSADNLTGMLVELRHFAAKEGVFLVKLEPELLNSALTLSQLTQNGLIPAAAIQPNSSTVLLDLTLPLNEILSGLNQKGRHAIKRAQRDGVIIRRVEATDENCRLFYDLLATTASGAFRIRSYDYYRSFWLNFAHAHDPTISGQLFFAYVDTVIVAGAYGLVYGHNSTYKDGASLRERPVYGASHLLQWELISWAKENGALTHDFCGAPPRIDIKNTQHPYYGIGRFKTSFNKQVTEYIGVVDLVIAPTRYKLWSTVGERIMQRISSKLRGENFY